jgi:hypothetical protein
MAPPHLDFSRLSLSPLYFFLPRVSGLPDSHTFSFSPFSFILSFLSLTLSFNSFSRGSSRGKGAVRRRVRRGGLEGAGGCDAAGCLGGSAMSQRFGRRSGAGQPGCGCGGDGRPGCGRSGRARWPGGERVARPGREPRAPAPTQARPE